MNSSSTRRLVRAKEFYNRLGVSRSTFYYMRKDGKIPEPVKITEKTIAWPVEQVETILNGIAAGEIRL